MTADAFDYVVVGAGPAGCAIAARLADARPDRTIALVEAGPAKASLLSNVPLGLAQLVPFKSRHNYAYCTTPQAGLNGRRGYQPRGRGVGGSSLINAMICTRGHPSDYDDWAAQGCSDWGWPDVLPYFRRSEDNERGADAWHGVGGPLHVADLRSRSPATQAFIAAAEQAGFARTSDFNGPAQEGVGAYQLFQKHGRRYNAGRAYLEQARRPNLKVIADTQVRRVLFEDRRATGVLHGRPGDEQTIAARAEVILAGDAFGSPQLLMLSGVGPAAHLRQHGIDVVQHLPDVGANLQDHVDHVLSLKAKGPGLFGLTAVAMLQTLAQIVRYLQSGEGMLTSNAAEAGGFVKTRPQLARPDVQLHFCIGIVDDHNRRLHFETGMSLHACVLRPKSRGTVRLASADIADAPLIDPAFLTEPDDLDVLVQGTRIAQRILQAPALARYEGKPLYDALEADETRLREQIRNRADTIYHPVGTCRMGVDDQAVVDPGLRVRGIDGLRVADGSIMPTLVGGNTQGPCAMIGEKAADLILGRTAPAP